MNRPTEESGWLRLEPVFLQFEEAWRTGAAPDLEATAALAAPADRSVVLAEIIKIDLEYRWRAGERPSVDCYLQQFPELRSFADVSGELLREELRLRREYDRRRDVVPRVDQPKSTTRRLGRYEVGEQIGQGGFATVYRGWDPELQRAVAIKVLKSEYGQHPDLRARIVREAQSAARLRHPAIVPIFEVGQDAEQFFIVYEFIPGQTLAHTFLQTHPAPMQVAQWIARLAEALDYAHRQGIVHRDVKPANVMMDRDGQPLLADFGLALNTEAGATLTQEGDLLGTPAYMSPEQANGQGHAVDGRSDVYSLGVMLYEGLCGQVPFAGNGPSILHQVLHEEPISVRRVRADVPADLETICLKAMAKEPAQRYATAGALAEDLQRYLNHVPILARPIGPLGRLLRWSRRKPALAGTIAAAAITIAAVVAISFWQVTAERDRFRQERDRAERHLYRSLVGQAKAQMQARDTGWWWSAMDDLQKAAQLDVPERNLDELRELAIACMGTEYPCFRLKETWTGHSQPVTCMAASADGRWVASGSKDRSVRLWKLPGGTPIALSGHTDAVTALSFHHASKWLISAALDGTVRLWDLRKLENDPASSLTPTRIFDAKIGAVRAAAFAPKADEFAVAGSDGEIAIWPIVGDAPVRQWRGHRGALTSLTYNSTGKVLFSSAMDHTVRAWDANSGTEVANWSLIDQAHSLDCRKGYEDLVWADRSAFGIGRAQFNKPASIHNGLHRESVYQAQSLSGGRILTAGGDGAIQLWQAATLKPLAVARGDFGPTYAFAIGSDDKAVFAGYHDGRLRWWELVEPQQRRLQTIPDVAAFHPNLKTLFTYPLSLELENDFLKPTKPYAISAVIGLALHDKKKEMVLAHHDGSIRLWNIQTGEARATWASRGSTLHMAVADPDRRHVATGSADGRLRIWNWEKGAVKHDIAANLGEVWQLAWSRDGQYIAAAGEYGIAVWKLDDLTKPCWQRRQPIRPMNALAFGDRILACTDASNAIVLCDIKTGEETGRLKGHTGPITALAFSTDGRRIASGAEDQTLRLWDLTAGKDQLLARPTVAPTWLAFDWRDRFLAAGSAGSGTNLHHLTKARSLRVIEPGSNCGQFTADGTALVFGSNRDGVATCTTDDMEKAFDLAVNTGADGTPTVFRQLSWIVLGGHSSRVWGLAVSPKGDRIATASHDQTAKLWDASTLELLRTWSDYTNVVWGIAFSADGNLLATGSERNGQGDITIYETDSGKVRWHFQDHRRLVVALAFHPTKPLLASASLDGSVRLWDIKEGQSLGLLHQFDQSVHRLAFRPDGRWLAGACHDHHVVLWNFDTPEQLKARTPDRVLSGHKNAVWAVAFDSDGRTLASAADDGTIVLWDASTFHKITTLRADVAGIRALTFSGDGEMLAAAGFPHAGIIWHLGRARQTLRGLNLDWKTGEN